jgi:hypothetical protein
VKLCHLASNDELGQPTGNIEERPEKVKVNEDLVKSDNKLLLMQGIK